MPQTLKKDDEKESDNVAVEGPQLSATDPSQLAPSSPSKLARLRHRRGRSGVLGHRFGLPLKGSTDEDDDEEKPVSIPPSKKQKSATSHVTRSRRRLAKIHFAIRQLQLRDLHAVFELGNQIFTASEFPNIYRTWDDFTIIEHLDGSPDYCFVAENEEGQLIAFLLGETITKSREGTRGYVQWVAVDAMYRRHGIATQLLEHYLQQARDAGVSRLLADTPSGNSPAIAMFRQVGLNHSSDHVYLTRQIPKDLVAEHVDGDSLEIEHSYTASKKRITIRNMEIGDLHPVYLIGEKIFTKANSNLYNFWDEHLVMQSFIADYDYCAVAAVKEDDDKETVIGFSFGTTIEKPKSSWKYGYLVWRK